MTKSPRDLTVFEMTVAGLKDSIAYSRGEKRSLVTVRLPAPPPPMDARKIARMRKRLNMSQGLFAAALNVSTKTVQGWEQGLRKPSHASLRLLQIIQEEPKVVEVIFSGR